MIASQATAVSSGRWRLRTALHANFMAPAHCVQRNQNDKTEDQQRNRRSDRHHTHTPPQLKRNAPHEGHGKTGTGPASANGDAPESVCAVLPPIHTCGSRRHIERKPVPGVSIQGIRVDVGRPPDLIANPGWGCGATDGRPVQNAARFSPAVTPDSVFKCTDRYGAESPKNHFVDNGKLGDVEIVGDLDVHGNCSVAQYGPVNAAFGGAVEKSTTASVADATLSARPRMAGNRTVGILRNSIRWFLIVCWQIGVERCLPPIQALRPQGLYLISSERSRGTEIEPGRRARLLATTGCRPLLCPILAAGTPTGGNAERSASSAAATRKQCRPHRDAAAAVFARLRALALRPRAQARCLRSDRSVPRGLTATLGYTRPARAYETSVASNWRQSGTKMVRFS